jgi:hypothetical protein
MSKALPLIGAAVGYFLAPETGGASLALTYAMAGSSIGSAASSLLTPKDTSMADAINGLKPGAPSAMPDPTQQKQAQDKSIAAQIARRGRASTILTDTGNQTLGGS